jgi:hypothetical protein
MKKQALSLVGVLSLLLAAGSAWAQAGSIRADVPFNFTINGTSMAAGTYTVSKTDAYGNGLVLQSENGGTVKFFTPHRVEKMQLADRTKLVFHCYSGRDHCFLYQLWVQGRNVGQELPKSSLEKEILAADRRAQDVSIIASGR